MWTITDVEKHKKGLTDKQKKQWVRIANSVLKRCMAKGGSEKDCAISAIKQTNGVVGNNASLYSICKNEQEAGYDVQLKVHQGKPHLVVPVVMMVEGVHNGSHGPLLHKIDELGKYPEVWNGIPVVLDHPTVDGVPVSANHPDIVDNVMLGRVYNTYVEDNKLKSEVWFDEERLSEVAPEVYEALNNGKLLEVSVGVFSDEEEVEGEWQGEKYVAVAHNHRPDHLAVLVESVGACSIKDGCGLGVNNTKTDGMETLEKVSAMEQKRKELGMSVAEFYAIPRDPPSESKLPIFDEAHVRNAMARFNQVEGVSAKEKAAARRKIIAKAKKFGIDITDFDDVDVNQSIIELNERGFSVFPLTNYSEASYRERMDAVLAILRSKDKTDTWHYIEEMYDDYVIYSVSTKDSLKMYKQLYTYTEGKAEFVGDPVEVRRRVEYVIINNSLNVNHSKKEVKMNAKSGCAACLEKVNALIANEQSKFTEEDREWLMNQEEAVLDKLAPVVVEKTVEKTVEVNKLSPEDQADLAWARKQREERRDKMIKGIQDNTSKDIWPDDVLKKMDEVLLEKLYQSVKKEEVVDYSPIGAGGLNANTSGSGGILLPTGIEISDK